MRTYLFTHLCIHIKKILIFIIFFIKFILYNENNIVLNSIVLKNRRINFTIRDRIFHWIRSTKRMQFI